MTPGVSASAIAALYLLVSAYNRPDEFQARIWGALERAKKEGRKDGQGEMAIHAFTVRGGECTAVEESACASRGAVECVQ